MRFRHREIRHSCSWQNQEFRSWDYTIPLRWHKCRMCVGARAPFPAYVFLHRCVQKYTIVGCRLELSHLASHHPLHSCHDVAPTHGWHMQCYRVNLLLSRCMQHVQMNKPSTLDLWHAHFPTCWLLKGLKCWSVNFCSPPPTPKVCRLSLSSSLPPSLMHRVPARIFSSSTSLWHNLTIREGSFQIPLLPMGFVGERESFLLSLIYIHTTIQGLLGLGFPYTCAGMCEHTHTQGLSLWPVHPPSCMVKCEIFSPTPMWRT